MFCRDITDRTGDDRPANFTEPKHKPTVVVSRMGCQISRGRGPCLLTFWLNQRSLDHLFWVMDKRLLVSLDKIGDVPDFDFFKLASM